MGLLDLFKSKEQKAQESKQRTEEEKELQEQKAETERINNILRTIIVFPGSKKEFEEFVGYECSVIDTKLKDSGIKYCKYDLTYTMNDELRKTLVNNGIVGIVNAVPIAIYTCGDTRGRYGLPVKRK